MKVLIVNTTYSHGGAAQIARMLHQALDKGSEFSSYFAYGRGPRVKDKEAFRFVWQPEVYLHAFLTRMTGLQGYGSWFSTQRLLRLIRRLEPDIIHLHNIHGYYLNLRIVRSLAKLGIPVVWTLHDGWPLTGRCAYLSGCDRWKNGCGHCPDLSRYPKTYVDSSAFMWRKKRAAFTQGWNPVIVCPSHWLADRVRESYLSQHLIVVVPNGIDVHTFHPTDGTTVRKRLEIPEDQKVILFVAADLRDERKGAKYFFEALRYVKADNWSVLTLGKRIKLPREIKGGVEIKQLGYVSSSEEVAQIYSAADVFCITSLDDNFPTTVLESLACGTPVVGFRVGGIPEQVTNDVGILIPPRDAKALGMAITRLLQNDELREKMSINSRTRAVDEYSVAKFRDRYVKVYNKAIKEDKR